MPKDISKPYTESRSTQEQGTQKAAGVMDEAREKASEAAHEVRRKTEKNLSSQKQRATNQLSNVSSALRETSGNLRDKNEEDGMARYFESAAEQVDRLSGYFSNRSVGEIVDEVEGIARREPALFLGGAALLGVLGSRFLKSSERRRMRDFDRGDSRYVGGDSRYISSESRYADRDSVRTRDVSGQRASDSDPFRTPDDTF